MTWTYNPGKENTRPSSRAPVLGQDSIVQIPDVPIALTQEAGRGCSGGTAEKHHKRLAAQNAGCLRPGGLGGTYRITRDVGLVDEDRTQCCAD